MASSLQITDEMRKELAVNGCLLLPGLIDAAAIARCRELLEITRRNVEAGVKGWKVAPPGPTAYNDCTGYRGPPPPFVELMEMCPQLAKACADMWRSKSVWFYDMEIFHKTDVGYSPDHEVFQRPLANPNGLPPVRAERGTPFHRDTSVTPFWGSHIANLWITFEECPAEHSLRMVKGSHFDGAHSQAKVTETTAVPGGKVGEVTSFAITPGDVVMLHPGTIHGAGTLGPSLKERNTLVLRVFGEDCQYRNRRSSAADKRYQGLENGDHFSLAGKAVNLHPLVMGPGDVPPRVDLSEVEVNPATGVTGSAKL